MVSNGNVNIYIERVSVDIGEHKSKVSAVINSILCRVHSRARFCVIINTRGSKPVLIKTTHHHKYLDQFLMVLLATFTTGLILVRQLMCNSGRNIGLLCLVLIVLQKRALL